MKAEKENTFRALREEPLLASSFWCKLKIHKWTRWSKPEISMASIWAKQNRECVNCGEYEWKRIRVD